MKPKFFLLILLFLVLRLGNILTAAESVSWFEELYEGTIAKELTEGLKAPFWYFQASPYGPGSLFIGVLAVPFFLLFGPSLFALKLVPLFFFFLPTLFILIFFLKRHFNEKAAFWGAFLFVFSPPAFTANSLIALGSHATSILFSVAMLCLFYEFLYSSKNRTLFLLLFGLVSGIAFYFIYTTFLTFLACFVSWFFLDRSTFFSRKLFFFLIALGVGLSPFIVYQIFTHLKGLQFLIFTFSRLHPLTEGSVQPLLTAFKKALNILVVGVPLSFCPRFGKWGQFLGCAYSLVLLGVLIPFLWREPRKNRTILPFLLYPLFFTVAYAGSIYSLPRWGGFFGARYFIPLHFFIFFLTAIALSTQKSRFLKMMIILLGLMSQSLLLFKEDFGKAFLYQGYSYSHWYSYRFLGPLPDKPDSIWKTLDVYPEKTRRLLYQNFIAAYTRIKGAGKNLGPLFRLQKSLTPPFRYYYLESLGQLLGSNEALISRWLGPLLKSCSEEERAYVYQGLAMAAKINHKRALLLGFIYRNRPTSKFSHSWLSVYEQNGFQEVRWNIRKRINREKGEVFGYSWVWRWPNFDEVIVLAPPDFPQVRSNDPENFYWGVGWGLRTVFSGDQVRAMDWIKQLPPEARGHAMEGSRAYDKWYWLA